MNDRELLKEYEQMPEETKQCFHTMLHAAVLYSKITGADEQVAFFALNDLFNKLEKENPELSTDSLLIRLSDMLIFKSQLHLELSAYSPPIINTTLQRWIV